MKQLESLSDQLELLSVDEVSLLISARKLYSEEFSRAGRLVDKLGRDDLREAFDELAMHLMTGENGRPDRLGFEKRNAIGVRIQQAIEGDLRGLDQFFTDIWPGPKDQLFRAVLKTVRAEIKLYCLEGGIPMQTSTSIKGPVKPATSTTAQQAQTSLGRNP